MALECPGKSGQQKNWVAIALLASRVSVQAETARGLVYGAASPHQRRSRQMLCFTALHGGQQGLSFVLMDLRRSSNGMKQRKRSVRLDSLSHEIYGSNHMKLMTVHVTASQRQGPLSGRLTHFMT